jgi:hypothetical protein
MVVAFQIGSGSLQLRGYALAGTIDAGECFLRAGGILLGQVYEIILSCRLKALELLYSIRYPSYPKSAHMSLPYPTFLNEIPRAQDEGFIEFLTQS